MTNYKFDHCVVTVTPTNQMYVSMVTPSLGVAIGGCGYAAKSSDELGLMAARLVGWRGPRAQVLLYLHSSLLAFTNSLQT